MEAAGGVVGVTAFAGCVGLVEGKKSVGSDGLRPAVEDGTDLLPHSLQKDSSGSICEPHLVQNISVLTFYRRNV
jgi:hypothetical protein